MNRKLAMLGLYGIMAAATAAMALFFATMVIHEHQPHAYRFYARTQGRGFQVLHNGQWKDLFVKGVNIGAALPGQWFTEFPEDEKIYLGWFEGIGEMNANCIRIYTLLPPEFYRALHSYNRDHPDKPLWLLQEIWPEENPEGRDYLAQAYVDEYFREIERTVDAIHGQADIAERIGRAHGQYDTDVSEYVLGYLVGRELEPEEVIATNEKNRDFAYRGDYLSSGPGASPSEAWLAMNCDHVLEYEDRVYTSQHPVAIVSWPTLDVKEHDSEWNEAGDKSREYNDRVSIDINRIDTGTRMEAGFFGAYHIYPNYPDFMNNESGYNSYYDEQGRLRYGGYLQEFIAGHSKYPALVAEFGLATGMGNAHASPDGLNHGGLTEKQQGDDIVRMMKAIKKEGYAGGIIFEWMDEWAKKTWTTEPFMIPYDRHAYWYNALDPEQNYGLLAMEPGLFKNGERQFITGNGLIRDIEIFNDAGFLYLNISLDRAPDLSKETLLIGLDTNDRSRGEFKYTPDADMVAPGGLEFLLQTTGPCTASLLAHPGYNIGNYRYASFASSKGLFEEIRLLVGRERVARDGSKIAAVYHNASQLNYGGIEGNSHNNWYVDGNTLRFRIPWGLLNFTDPSSLSVLDDSTFSGDLSRDRLKTSTSDGIMVSVVLYDPVRREKIDILNNEQPYLWEPWNTPPYRERLKESYYIIQEYFSALP